MKVQYIGPTIREAGMPVIRTGATLHTLAPAEYHEAGPPPTGCHWLKTAPDAPIIVAIPTAHAPIHGPAELRRLY